ncbi:hypothetical protein [Lutibaculum baratangense]|uniref:Uncharacterized protein n=1 Tax=Lutibaculum baratangense AMV1 TaxID=631454 RepID=V4RAB9_9HYPH|nr:hypothetical protein [Lutibaculum baratangense]ESR23121.1 hypothetical protein N177_3189 [Lutibaculum baratangense AMV1]
MSAFVLPVDEIDPVGFALSYPFARPAGSFVFGPGDAGVAAALRVEVAAKRTGEAAGLEVPLATLTADVGGEQVEFADRVPVLASGSNAAPSQLARKFGSMSIPPIPVVEVVAEGLASVYSAHVARYGSIAATLAPCDGVRSRLHLLFVPACALEHLNRTESVGSNYMLCELTGARLPVGSSVVAPLAYISRRGPARVDGMPRALPGTADEGLPEATQAEMQASLQRELGERGELNGFVARLIREDAFRARATDFLASTTERIVPGGTKILAGG